MLFLGLFWQYLLIYTTFDLKYLFATDKYGVNGSKALHFPALQESIFDIVKA